MKPYCCNICKAVIGNEFVSVPRIGGICHNCYNKQKDLKLEKSFFLKGRAVGVADIKTDTVVFHYRQDIFNLPTSRMRGVVRYNRKWCFYTAPIKILKSVAEKVVR